MHAASDTGHQYSLKLLRSLQGLAPKGGNNLWLKMAELEEEKAETAPFQEKEVTEYRVTKDDKEDHEDQRNRIRVLIIVIAVIVLVGVAFALGYVVRLVVHRCGGESGPSDNMEKLIQEAAENVSSSNIQEQLRYSTICWTKSCCSVGKLKYHCKRAVKASSGSKPDFSRA